MQIKQRELERRFLNSSKLTIKRAEGEEKEKSRTLVGYAAVFNTLSEDLGGFREKISPGAFARSLKEKDVRALFNHDKSSLLGRTGAGTLKLAEDETGLRFELTLPNTSVADDVLALVERGDLSGNSFGFWLYENGSKFVREGEDLIHHIMPDGIELQEVSIVTWPAYDATTVGVRDLFQSFKEESEKEKPADTSAMDAERLRQLRQYQLKHRASEQI